MLLIFGWAAIGLLGLILALPLISKLEWLISLSYLVRYLAYVLVTFFVAYDSVVYGSEVQARGWIRVWIAVLMGAGLLMAMSGFIQLYLLPDLSVLAKYGWDPHIDRLVTAMLDPNYAGCYFSVIIGVAVSLYLHLKQHYLARGALLILSAIMLVALLLTFSRSGYLMLAGVLGVIALVKSRWLIAVGLVVAILAVVLVPRVQTRLIGAFEVDASAQPRIVSWQNSWHIASDNWLLGVGFNTYRYAQDRYGIVSLDNSGNAGAGADSSWLFIWATTGVVGLLLFVANYLGLTCRGVMLYWRQKTPVVQALSLALVAVLLGLAPASQFNNALFYTWVIQPVWLLAGLVVGLSDRKVEV
jgi:O-antigen ligase